MQAQKRKHNETAEKLETYEELFKMIKTCDESAVAQTVRWIRSGQNPQAIVDHMKAYNKLHGPGALQTFLINLAHSTGSLRQIAKLAVSMSAPNNSVQIPNPEVFEALCNRIVYFSYMEDLLLRPAPYSNRRPPVLLGGAAEPQEQYSQYKIALQSGTFRDDTVLHPYQVPARPWTTLFADDDAVSHLVSLFLVWINPTWRFVEADLFLLGKLCLEALYRSVCTSLTCLLIVGMRSKMLTSDFCSPLLVNSILAIASVSSDPKNRSGFPRTAYSHRPSCTQNTTSPFPIRTEIGSLEANSSMMKPCVCGHWKTTAPA